MVGLLIVDKNKTTRNTLADLLIEEGYRVAVTDSAAQALYDIVKNNYQIVILGEELNDLNAADLIAMLKQCKREVSIILVSDSAPLPLITRIRENGIFYHALTPVSARDREEIRQAVRCAFSNLSGQHALH